MILPGLGPIPETPGCEAMEVHSNKSLMYLFVQPSRSLPTIHQSTDTAKAAPNAFSVEREKKGLGGGKKKEKIRKRKYMRESGKQRSGLGHVGDDNRQNARRLSSVAVA